MKTIKIVAQSGHAWTEQVADKDAAKQRAKEVRKENGRHRARRVRNPGRPRKSLATEVTHPPAPAGYRGDMTAKLTSPWCGRVTLTS